MSDSILTGNLCNKAKKKSMFYLNIVESVILQAKLVNALKTIYGHCGIIDKYNVYVSKIILNVFHVQFFNLLSFLILLSSFAGEANYNNRRLPSQNTPAKFP